MRGIRRKLDKEVQGDFMSLVAHQLRTLPNIIGWDIESLLMKKTNLTKKERELLVRVADANKRMVNLVDIMLNISRIELGSVSITPTTVDVAQCITEELALLSEAYRRKLPRITTIYPMQPCLLQTDQDFIHVILQNLLSNAIKYTPTNGEVTVTLKDGPRVCKLEVADTGYGIPASEQKHVFSKLFRAENVQSSAITGNGLGLHLTKELVKLLHGRIWFRSDEAAGTHFFVELPHRTIRKRKGATTLVLNNTFPALPPRERPT